MGSYSRVVARDISRLLTTLRKLNFLRIRYIFKLIGTPDLMNLVALRFHLLIINRVSIQISKCFVDQRKCPGSRERVRVSK
jgi:hypothetical protein